MTIRESLSSDAPRLREFLRGLCLEARRLRFFSGGIDVEGMADRLAQGGPDGIALVALDADGAIVGHALCVEATPGRAEVAVEVADHLHGLGLGTMLVERLAELAEARGTDTFTAVVMPENREMLDVFRDGFGARVAHRPPDEKVEFPTCSWRRAKALYDGFEEPPRAQRSPSSSPLSRA